MLSGMSVNTLSSEWCTPKKYKTAISDFFNNDLKLDPCSNKDSIIDAYYKWYYPQTDGLLEDWDFSTIYVNPPYGRFTQTGTTIKNWFDKSYTSYTKYDNEILMLVPVATNTSHWKNYVFNKCCGVCFLYDTRLKFRINGNEDNKGAPMACCFIYYGSDFNKFKKVFSEFGFCCNLS